MNVADADKGFGNQDITLYLLDRSPSIGVVAGGGGGAFVQVSHFDVAEIILG